MFGAVRMLSSTESLETIQVNLKVLAAIKQGERISLTGRYFELSPNTVLTSLSRLWYRENRTQDFNNIAKLMEDAIRILQTYMCSKYYEQTELHKDRNNNPKTHSKKKTSSEKSNEQEKKLNGKSNNGKFRQNFIKMFTAELKKAIDGVSRWKCTYEGDTKMVASIDVLVQKVEYAIQEAEVFLDGGSQPFDASENDWHRQSHCPPTLLNIDSLNEGKGNGDDRAYFRSSSCSTVEACYPKQENNIESGGMYKGVMDEKATIVDLLGLGDEANSIPVAHLRTSLESRENSGAAYSFSSFESDNEDSDVDGQ